jgi:hypothetical protein
MDFYLRTVIIILAIIVTGAMILMYSQVINSVQPLADQIPREVNNYAGGEAVSKKEWVVNRAHLAQAVISRQGQNDVFLSWTFAAWPPANIPTYTPARFPTELTMRLFYPTAAEIATLPQYVQDEIRLRGGFLLLNPQVDLTDAAGAGPDRINNALPNRRVNVLNVRGTPGSHYLAVQHYLNVLHPTERSFKITQYQHDNGDAFFVICLTSVADVLCP